jgi:hypothetical protein
LKSAKIFPSADYFEIFDSDLKSSSFSVSSKRVFGLMGVSSSRAASY